MRECLICGKRYEPKRYDSYTCGNNACRCKLSRQRKKAREEAEARLFSTNEQKMLLWLNKHVPSAETDLRLIYTVYGKEAFNRAANALKAVASYTRQHAAP